MSTDVKITFKGLGYDMSDQIPVLQPITRRTITAEEALRDRCAELETCIRMAIRAFEGDLAPAIAEAACRDALLP